jgi:L-amino acid N-acyltransferase YncA
VDTPLIIRAATEADWPAIWAMFRQVAAAGDAFAYDTDTPESVARQLWFEPPARPFVAEFEGDLAGTYYVRPNQPGRGSHVANAGYLVAAAARGQGIASALCAHSIATARQHGYRAMQFNYVVSTNIPAIRVWEKHGFAVVGRVPQAFRHDSGSFVDVLIFHREL